MNIVRDHKLKVIAESFRDWGRDCWCPSGKDNCNKRFDWQLGVHLVMTTSTPITILVLISNPWILKLRSVEFSSSDYLIL